MKKLENVLKKAGKVCGVVALSVVTAAFSVVTVSAYSTVTLAKYTNVALDINQEFNPVSYMYGYFESGNSSRGPRAGTHYNPGSLAGAAYTQLYYRKSNSTTETMAPGNGYESGNAGQGWIRSDWVTVPSGYIAASSISFVGVKLNSYGDIILREVTFVDRSKF